MFALIRSTMLHPEAARMSFDLIETLVADGPDNSVSLDNFSGLLTVVDDFATSAGMLQEQQQQRGRRNELLTSSKYLLSPYFLLFSYNLVIDQLSWRQARKNCRGFPTCASPTTFELVSNLGNPRKPR